MRQSTSQFTRHPAREKRRMGALLRQEARDARTPEEQLALCAQRRGNSTKESKRLLRAILTT